MFSIFSICRILLLVSIILPSNCLSIIQMGSDKIRTIVENVFLMFIRIISFLAFLFLIMDNVPENQ